MTPYETELLKIYLMVAPLLVVGLGLFVFWFTGWADKREQQKRHPAE
jgi:hypothetical protein